MQLTLTLLSSLALVTGALAVENPLSFRPGLATIARLQLIRSMALVLEPITRSSKATFAPQTPP